jgi:hypothetical protein
MKLARIVVAAHALWLVLSRLCLPMLFEWPREFWAGAPAGAPLRYLWVFAPGFERALYAALIIALVVVLIDRWRTGNPACPDRRDRLSSIAASILLYHFAPLEDVFIAAPGPYADGLTVDVLALAILGFAPRGRQWPLTLIRVAVAAQYVFSTIVKVEIAGIGWFSGRNIRDLAILFDRLSIAPYPRIVIERPWLASLIGAAWLAISIGMAAAPFSRRAAMIVVPLAAIAHVLAVPLFGIVFLSAPLLLVFAGWPQRSETPNSSLQRASA